MSATRRTIDWTGLRERMTRCQTAEQGSGSVDRERLRKVFRERALQLARRGQREPSHTAIVPVVVFRLAAERFGIALAHVKQVFPRVPITPVPGTGGALLGVANLGGTLRSVIDLGALLDMPAAKPDAGYVVLVRVRDKSFGLWVEAVEGVRLVDLESLISVEAIAAKNSADCLRGTTDDRIVVINLEPLFERIRDNVRVTDSKKGGTES